VNQVGWLELVIGNFPAKEIPCLSAQPAVNVRIREFRGDKHLPTLACVQCSHVSLVLPVRCVGATPVLRAPSTRIVHAIVEPVNHPVRMRTPGSGVFRQLDLSGIH
jgi:hypothetical protein